MSNRAFIDIETRCGQTEIEATVIKFACADAVY